MQPALVSRAETQVLGLAPVVPISLQASSVIKNGGTSLPVSILGLAPSSSEADGHLHRAPSWTSIVKRVPITDRGINATLLSQHFVGLNRRRGELEGCKQSSRPAWSYRKTLSNRNQPTNYAHLQNLKGIDNPRGPQPGLDLSGTSLLRLGMVPACSAQRHSMSRRNKAK